MLVLSGALVGFYMLRNKIIQSKMEQEAASFRSIVETAMARADFPRWTTRRDVDNFFHMIPSARMNPYTGTPRTWSLEGGDGAYFAVKVESVTVSAKDNNPIGENNILGGFAYLWNDDIRPENDIYTVVDENGESRNFYGWLFYETDMYGTITVAIGGLPLKIEAYK